MVAGVTKRRSGPPTEGDVAAVAALKDPVRLALYEYVTGQSVSVSRDQAAEAIGVRREMAAFHLDRLADEGLLAVEFRRLSGRQGPGAGRTAKLYRRSVREVQVSLPARRYDVAARLFAEALAARNPAKALIEISRAFGESLGVRTREQAGRRIGARRLLESVASTLGDYGYEPSVTEWQLILRNCPFDALTQEYRKVVCTMNRAVMDGLVTGLGAHDLTTIFQPQAGQCCIIIKRRRNVFSNAH
jgi:predicted ArsR family transcriptional regulator